MKKYILSILAIATGLGFATSCIEEIDPQSTTVTSGQASNAIGSYDNFVSAITSTLSGNFNYVGNSAADTKKTSFAEDFGYSSFYLQRDVMGNDIAYIDGGPYTTWYTCGTGLGPMYANCQIPWTVYYGWIKNCNTVISLAGDEPSEQHKAGAGIAHAMRALFYMELAQMFAPRTYAADADAPTVPIVTEKTSLEMAANNPRATNKEIWNNLIIPDLDEAEKYLEGYTRPDKTTPDLSVVYGLKARAYLVMENWEDAEKYAKMAKAGYSLLTDAQYNDRATGFNTPDGNSSWMLCTKFKSDDYNILDNDADSSWGSIMILEMTTGMGYGNAYGYPMMMDRHLYETIPATDFRKKAFLDFALDDIDEDHRNELVQELEKYSDYPDALIGTAASNALGTFGGLSVKFRATGGEAGHASQYIGYCVAVPMMRVEEMYLIEAEAAGMQSEARGIQLLTDFAKTRDAIYTYGTHKDAYNNQSTPAFQNEVWWQRRVELWGEGFATFDVKRLQKGIIRSYAGSNHAEGYRWNTNSVPQWMTLCIVGGTEADVNTALINNPTPEQPQGDSPEYSWK
ncbi:MAG: RagB/SusD family nutrient uptake outer membrane protein [Muribaculaceae bacterium]|nr:RagB/SusD family nutrient uptake outer membrane protein [Muribaculaceae bacterium]